MRSLLLLLFRIQHAIAVNNVICQYSELCLQSCNIVDETWESNSLLLQHAWPIIQQTDDVSRKLNWMESVGTMEDIFHVLCVKYSKYSIDSQHADHAWTQLNDLLNLPRFYPTQDWRVVRHLLGMTTFFEGVKLKRGVVQFKALLRVLLAILYQPISLLPSLARYLVLLRIHCCQ